MNLFFRTALTVLATSLVVVLTSCNPGSSGLFSYIAQETKEVTGSLAKGTVTSMAEYGTNYYAAGGGKLFSRAVDGGTWTAVSIPDQTTYLAVASIGNFQVYALAATGTRSRSRQATPPTSCPSLAAMGTVSSPWPS